MLLIYINDLKKNDFLVFRSKASYTINGINGAGYEKRIIKKSA